MRTTHRARRKQVAIVGSVLLLHGAGLWGLQSGLLQHSIEQVIPIEVISDWVAPSKPPAEPPPRKTPAPASVQPAATPPPMLLAPQPVAIADSTPAPANAPSGTIQAQVQLQVPAPATALAVVAAPSAARVAHAQPATVEPPSSDAEYLHNPKPEYPALSRLRGEQGKVVVNVLIGVDGAAQKAEIKQSSGFERLDQAALAAVRAWRYVPGKRDGVPEPMWVEVPMPFKLLERRE